MEFNREKMPSLQEQDLRKSLNVHSKLSLEPEACLQSLGFTINNGKPRFILDDDICPCSNVAPSNFSVIDESDTMSFVVISKNSLDSIRASSLASYIDIQQKSMSLDLNSTIASWESTEVHLKLNQLLQENGKLKETLKQNNIAIKQQFNTLANWQEDIVRVHQNHKKKFAETMKLINYLKKENAELKMKLSTECINTEMEYPILNINQIDNNIKEISIPRTELQEPVSLLSDELNTCIKCRNFSDTENLFTTSNVMNSQLKQAVVTKLNDSNYFYQSPNYDTYQHFEDINNCTECEKCLTKDEQIGALKKTIVLLKHKLQYAIAPAQFCVKNSANQKVQQYIEKLFKLNISFDKQVNHCTLMEKYLKKFKEAYENMLNESDSKVENHNYIGRYFHNHEHLRASYEKLIEEQQKFMEDKENVFVLQNEFQKALLDCISIPYELETMLEEKTEESIMKNKVTSESIQKAAESKEENTESKQLLEEERTLLVKERESLEKERMLLNIQTANLEMEKSSLDHQSQLNECHYIEKLEAERAKFEVKFDQLVNEIGTLHESIQKKDLQVKELQEIVAEKQMGDDLIQAQLKIYEEDFERERKIKELLLQEKMKLNLDLQKQIRINEEVLRSIDNQQSLHLTELRNIIQHVFSLNN